MGDHCPSRRIWWEKTKSTPHVMIVSPNNAFFKVRRSSKITLSKFSINSDPLHYYTLQCTKALPSPPPPMLSPDHLDYSPATEQPMLQATDQYGHTLCHRHRQYDTMPKLIDTTSGYCSSSNSSYSNSSGIPRSRSFQPSNRKSKRKSSEGVLVWPNTHTQQCIPTVNFVN